MIFIPYATTATAPFSEKITLCTIAAVQIYYKYCLNSSLAVKQIFQPVV